MEPLENRLLLSGTTARLTGHTLLVVGEQGRFDRITIGIDDAKLDFVVSMGKHVLPYRAAVSQVNRIEVICGGQGSRVTISVGQTNALKIDVKGGRRRDSVTIDSGDGHLSGGGGDDLLIGGSGNDTLIGGDGSDTLSGRGGDDLLFGDNGNDKLFGGKGNDTIMGGGGSDRLIGYQGTDVLHGGAGNDVLAGFDIKKGSDEKDWLFGEQGNDALFISPGDRVRPGAGVNRVVAAI
jgi:Ca2+-binding RTX toxin-like protein